MQVIDFTNLIQVCHQVTSVDFIKLHQVCENQNRSNLIFIDLLQVVEFTCIKLVDNLQQTCYHQAKQAMQMQMHPYIIFA